MTLPTVPAGTALLGLLAKDFAALADGASIGDTWAEHSGLGHDFTRGAGATGLLKQTAGGHTVTGRSSRRGCWRARRICRIHRDRMR